MTMEKDAQKRARRAAGEAAAALVDPGMVVGLGTGDTASYAVRALAARGLCGLRCVPTSIRTAALARELHLAVVELDDLPPDQMIDLTIDGADEIDPRLRLIKGAGGALLREKLVARNSQRLIIVADTGKLVTRLGERARLPVEIVPFGVPQILASLLTRFPEAELRHDAVGPQRTDGGNRLVDLPLTVQDLENAGDLHRRIKLLVGVIETGLFLEEAELAFIGEADGSVTQRHASDG